MAAENFTDAEYIHSVIISGSGNKLKHSLKFVRIPQALFSS